jgi:hypothetical protein
MVDRGLLGLFKRREALLHADPTGRDLSLAMRDAVAGLERELAARGEPFDEAVRRKRRDCGLPVPLPDRVLPFRPGCTVEETDALRTLAEELERDLDLVGSEVPLDNDQEAERGGATRGDEKAIRAESGGLQSGDGSGQLPTATGPRERVVTYASLRARSAELRMREAYAALEVVEFACATPLELERLERAFHQATVAYEAARSLSERTARLRSDGRGSCRPCGTAPHGQGG